jgi:uncharacterized protein (DUF427 family)
VPGRAGDRVASERHEEQPMNDFPSAIVPVNHVEPVPRRIRATLAGHTVLDTTRARYVWEIPAFPQYYIPVDDVRRDLLVADGHTQTSRRGSAELHGLRAGDQYRPRAARLFVESPIDGLAGTVHFEWDALDAWYEEDEQVFVHPRNPYTRVDALRSTRRVRIECDGVVLGESAAPVMVFETGLPTRYYIDRAEVDFQRLVASDTVTRCPYKGVTSGYWSLEAGETLRADLAWSYDFPTRQLAPIAGLIAFYNEKVDTFLDDRLLERPMTRFSTAND